MVWTLRPLYRRTVPSIHRKVAVPKHATSVLNNEAVIAVNIHVIRVFWKMRERLLANHKDILLALERLKGTVDHNSRDVKVIFKLLKRTQKEQRNRALLTAVDKQRSPSASRPGRGNHSFDHLHFTITA